MVNVLPPERLAVRHARLYLTGAVVAVPDGHLLVIGHFTSLSVLAETLSFTTGRSLVSCVPARKMRQGVP
jgi:hypothetical protein